MAGFLGQFVGLVEGCLGVVAGTLELLLAGLDTAEHGVEGVGQAADLVPVAARRAQRVVLLAGDLARQLLEAANRPRDHAPDLPRHQQPEQYAAGEDRQAGGQGTGIEHAGQFAGGHQQQVAGFLAGYRQFGQVGGAEFPQAPAGQVGGLQRQVQLCATLQLGQQAAVAVVERRGAQWRVAVQALQHRFGVAFRGQGLGADGRGGEEPAKGHQALGRDAFLGNPVGGADEGQVGDEQDGGEQDQQGGEQFAAD
ncbi:hypothetical protein D9M68_575860 [compost metagenome]